MNPEELKTKVFEICEKYNFTITNDDSLICDAMGIGDILFRFSCINHKFIQKKFVINLWYFSNYFIDGHFYYENPLNQLEFRIKLINDIVNNNTNLSLNDVIYVYNYPLEDINQKLPYESMNKFYLELGKNDKQQEEEEYIIFHTKCRHNKTEDYGYLKERLRLFFRNFISKYKVYIMGEQDFPDTLENISCQHGITTVYKELLEIKNNNPNVQDITLKELYNNLDYENYKKDVMLIKNAKYNICFGQGGQLCSSIILGKSSIFYYKIQNIHLNKTSLQCNVHYYCDTIDSFLNTINEKC